MKQAPHRNIRGAVAILIFLIFLVTNTLIAQTSVLRTNKSLQTPIESKLYPDKSITERLNYDLIATNNGTFVLKFTNKPNSIVQIKIFDLIGNLIMSEQLDMVDSFQREYKFPQSANKIYVVKVASGQENLIKKINI